MAGGAAGGRPVERPPPTPRAIRRPDGSRRFLLNPRRRPPILPFMTFPAPNRAIVAGIALLIALLAPRVGSAQQDTPTDVGPATADVSLADVTDAGLAYHLAREARARGETERAAALLDIAVRLDPDAVLPRLDRVEVLLELNRPSGAGLLLEPIATEVAAESEARPATAARYHRLRGAIALRSGRPDMAIEGYEKAVRLAPWDLGLRAQLIGLHRASGDPAAAIPHLEAASRFLPFNGELRAELGDALLDLERYAEAEAVYLEALELVPASSELHDRIERKIARARAAIER